MQDITKIRNFSIIAHIDHGKSTLADRILEFTKTIDLRQMKDQIMDSMELERERGISIKAKAIRLLYNGYILNLIDTPGHVDFNYEVSRALAACEGAILIVDATQGIEAQTLANAHLAQTNNLKIIPVVNKIDLPNAQLDVVAEELKHVFKIDPSQIIYTSAKEGTGVEDVVNAVIERIPPPKGDETFPLQALIFDSRYDAYRGVIVFVRIMNGKITAGQKVTMMGTSKEFEVQEVGTFKLDLIPKEALTAGEVGYIIANIKIVADAHVGDTITTVTNPATVALAGYKKVKPMVFCGFYPIEGEQYKSLKEALEKLQLNDAALFYEPETSGALGFGFRCGFLGLLHLEIIQERLEREYGLNLIATAPNVVFKVNKTNGKDILIDSPKDLPSPTEILSIEEPYLKVTIFTLSDFVGGVMQATQDKRGTFLNMEYIDPTRVMLSYEIPLSEVIIDFHDLLKSISKGYASMDYEMIGYRETNLEKLDILINEEIVDALSSIVPREKAFYAGKALVEKLRKVIPRQMFDIPIQAAIGGRVVARETVKAMRKNVLQKCYGGDITRKRKLLEKQKEGKKRMKRVGRVDIPQEAFFSVLKAE